MQTIVPIGFALASMCMYTHEELRRTLAWHAQVYTHGHFHWQGCSIETRMLCRHASSIPLPQMPYDASHGAPNSSNFGALRNNIMRQDTCVCTDTTLASGAGPESGHNAAVAEPKVRTQPKGGVPMAAARPRDAPREHHQ